MDVILILIIIIIIILVGILIPVNFENNKIMKLCKFLHNTCSIYGKI